MFSLPCGFDYGHNRTSKAQTSGGYTKKRLVCGFRWSAKEGLSVSMRYSHTRPDTFSASKNGTIQAHQISHQITPTQWSTYEEQGPWGHQSTGLSIYLWASSEDDGTLAGMTSLMGAHSCNLQIVSLLTHRFLSFTPDLIHFSHNLDLLLRVHRRQFMLISSWLWYFMTMFNDDVTVGIILVHEKHICTQMLDNKRAKVRPRQARGWN